MGAAALEDVADHRPDVWCARQVELDQEHWVDEITDAAVEPVAVVAGQGVKLLREVLVRRSDLPDGRTYRVVLAAHPTRSTRRKP